MNNTTTSDYRLLYELNCELSYLENLLEYARRENLTELATSTQIKIDALSEAIRLNS